MNEESVKIRCFHSPASKIIYDLFCLLGHASNISLFYRIMTVIFMSLILSMGIFFQAAKLITTNFDLAVVIDVVPPMACLLSCLLYLPMSYANRNKYEKLLIMFEMYEKRKRTEEEDKIKEEYDKYIMMVSTFTSITVLLGSVGLFMPAFLPPVLDVVIPRNESRPRALPFQAEHFVNEEDYFYEILLFQYINILVVIAIVGSGEVTLFMCILYTCGMFAVLGYKLDHVTRGKDGVKEECIHRDEELISRIGEFVESHKFILKYIWILNMSCNKLFLLILGTTLIFLSICLVQVINPNLTTLKSILMTLITLGQLFLVNLGGQLVIDASEKLPQNTYNNKWYNCSIKVQKLFVLLLVKTCKPCGLSVFNVLLISFQNFSAVLQTGVSYAMVLKQFDE